MNFAVGRMEESEAGEEQLYYFSAIDSMIQRMFNIEYDPDLVYAHFILFETYKAFNQRIQAIQKGGDKLIPLYEAHFLELSNLIRELAEKIQGKKSIDSTLKKFVILLYSTTGNGHYLLQKGLLKL